MAKDLKETSGDIDPVVRLTEVLDIRLAEINKTLKALGQLMAQLNRQDKPKKPYITGGVIR